MNYGGRPLLMFASVMVALACGCACLVAGPQNRGPVLEQWRADNKTFAIRVTAYAEEGAYVNGAYYLFEAAATGSDRWREVVIFRHDDQPELPRDQVRFVNDKVGYLFMGWVYAVTTDGGVNWSVWDATKNLPNWQCCNYNLIRDVNVGEGGDGVMKLNPIQGRSGEVPELHTGDYGRHWRAE